MKNSILTKPLVQSVLTLALPSLLLYLIVGNPEATIWSSFGIIVMGVLKTIQWIIAMTLALFACLAFLFAIFFGAVALFDRNTSAKIYGNLKTLLLNGFPLSAGQCCSSTCAQSVRKEQDFNYTKKKKVRSSIEVKRD